MGKPNQMLAKMEAKYDLKYRLMYQSKFDTMTKMFQDAAMIAAHEVLGLGPGRAEKFCAAYRDAMNKVAGLVWEAQKDDKEFVYAKEKVDQLIREIVGDDKFVPWEERYGQR